MVKKKSKESLRNLVQYKDLSDEEFEKVWEERQAQVTIKVTSRRELEVRIEEMLDKFRVDYTLDELKVNDTLVLKALIRAIITLGDYEDILYDTQEGGIDSTNIRIIDALNKQTSILRRDISRFQEDLRMTRRVRKEEREDSIEAYITNLQDKANRFYKNKIFRVICPNCEMMIMDSWFLYPEANNKIILECGRLLESEDDDEVRKCTGKLEVTSLELQELQREYKDKFPEGL